MGAGHLRVSGGAVTGKAVEASFAYNVPGPTWNESNVGGALALTVNQRDTGSFLNPFNIRNDWTFRLGKGIPVALQINNGAGDSTLDLRGLDVRNLNINQGVGAVHIDLRQPWTSDLDVTVHDGVGDTTIYVPTSVGVQVHVHAGIGSTHASGLIQQNGDYVNAS
jgi:hypothetical protein